MPSDFGARSGWWSKLGRLFTGQNRQTQGWVRPMGLSLDADNNLYFTDPGSASVGFLDRKNQKLHRWEKVGGQAFDTPVAILRLGPLIFVADTGLGRVLGFDLKGKIQVTISAPLVRPSGLASLNGHLIVSDTALHQLFTFDPKGNLTGTHGRRGAAPGEFNFPTHLHTRDDKVYVTDAMNFRIQVLDAALAPLSQIGTLGQGSGQFSRPKGVTTDVDGHLYVVDALFDNVQAFDPDGTFLLHWGQAGQQPGEFWLPGGIAIDQNNIIYVADSYNQRIQLFQYLEAQP